MAVKVEIGSDVILSYKRLGYTPWHALAELVDNSTESFFRNRELLEPLLKDQSEKLEVRIVYDRENSLLRISDNAMGMDAAELDNALKIGKPTSIVSGRSQFGLGLKTAACWLGEEWAITTKKFGTDYEIATVFNVEDVAKGNVDLPERRTPKPAGLHYTVIEVRRLHSKLKGRRLSKVKDFLKSMYRVDIRTGLLDLWWEGKLLEWDAKESFLANAAGEPYKRDFSFEVNGKRVWGYVGILGEGRSGRPNAGFSILRFGRVIRGHPDAWRPEEIFGQYQGTNDLINQRITGEIHLDDFDVSHTKDDILWTGDEEDEVQKLLGEISRDFVELAKVPRKGKGDKRGPTQTEVQTAVDELRTEMQSQEFVDLVEIESVPPPDVIEQANQPILSAAEREEPRFNASVGETTCRVYLSFDESPNDPYFATDVGDMGIIVVVNCNHPHWSQLAGSEGVLNYLRHCVYDSIAEWQCRRKNAALQPNTIKLLKDRLLRLPSVMEQDMGVESETSLVVDQP